jgi:hypothetical protein
MTSCALVKVVRDPIDELPPGLEHERIREMQVRLMKMIKPIRVILETLIATVPQLANILLLLFLVYSMFAVVAIQGFSMTKNGLRYRHNT